MLHISVPTSGLVVFWFLPTLWFAPPSWVSVDCPAASIQSSPWPAKDKEIWTQSISFNTVVPLTSKGWLAKDKEIWTQSISFNTVVPLTSKGQRDLNTVYQLQYSRPPDQQRTKRSEHSLSASIQSSPWPAKDKEIWTQSISFDTVVPLTSEGQRDLNTVYQLQYSRPPDQQRTKRSEHSLSASIQSSPWPAKDKETWTQVIYFTYPPWGFWNQCLVNSRVAVDKAHSAHRLLATLVPPCSALNGFKNTASLHFTSVRFKMVSTCSGKAARALPCR